MSSNPTAAFTLASLSRVVGQAAYGRGARYARSGAVAGIDWYPDELVAAGTVDGTDSYETVAQFDLAGEDLVFVYGECSCPVRMNCKHVVALTVVLMESAATEDLAAPPGWAEILEAALPEPSVGSDRMPLGVQLSLSHSSRSDRWAAVARVVRPGKKGWVNGNTSWPEVGRLSEADPRQVLLLAELWSIAQVGRRTYYSYGQEKDLDLTAVAPSRLW